MYAERKYLYDKFRRRRWFCIPRGTPFFNNMESYNDDADLTVESYPVGAIIKLFTT